MTFALAPLRNSLDLRGHEALAEHAAGKDLEEILSRHLRAVEAAAQGDLLTSVLLLDPSGHRLLHGAAPSLPKAYCDAIHGVEIGPTVGSCGTAAFLGQPVYVTDTATDPLWADYRALAEQFGFRACWSTPIRGPDGRLLGTFAIYYLTPRSPTVDELLAVHLITRHVANAILAYGPDAAPPRHRSKLRLVKQEPTGLWTRMQQIERCRHRAELAEQKAREGSLAFRVDMEVVAAQWRALAQEYEALLKRDELA